MRVEVMQYYGLTQPLSQAGYYETDHHKQLIKDIKGAILEGRLIAVCSEEDPVMGLERRGCIVRPYTNETTSNGRTLLDKAKPFSISKVIVWEAYKRVKANGGTAGVDCQSKIGRAHV